MVDLDRLVDAVREKFGHFSSSEQAAAVNDHVVEISLGRDQLQQNRVSHERREDHRHISDRQADEQEHSHTRCDKLPVSLRPEYGKNIEQKGAQLSHCNHDPEDERELIGQAPSLLAVHGHAVSDQNPRHGQ